MHISPASLSTLTKSFRVNFLRGLESAPATWMEYATRVPSTRKTQNYPFLGKVPRMREWLGPRVSKAIDSYDFEVVNRKFEDTIELSREDLEDNEDMGLFAPLASDLGMAAAMLPDDLVAEALIGADAALCYDGQFFFDTDHPYDGGTQANLLTSQPLNEANYIEARAAMRSLLDDRGDPLNVNPNLLVVPPSLEHVGRTLVEAQMIDQGAGDTNTHSGQSNVYRGTARVLVVPRLEADSAEDWYLMDTTRAIKPFIFQERIAPKLTAKTSETDDNVFDRDVFVWGTRARGAAFGGLWQLAFKCDAS